jgi:hypothetical protein
MHVPSTSNSSLTSVLPGMLEYYSALELLSGAELTWEVAVRLHLYTGRASAPIVRGNNAAIDRSISASDARLGCRRVVARARGHETGCTVLGPTPDPTPAAACRHVDGCGRWNGRIPLSPGWIGVRVRRWVSRSAAGLVLVGVII